MRTCNNECIGMKGRGFRHDRIIGGARAGNLLFFPFPISGTMMGGWGTA